MTPPPLRRVRSTKATSEGQRQSGVPAATDKYGNVRAKAPTTTARVLKVPR